LAPFLIPEETTMSAAAVAGMIGFYQRWLSPLKGFSCAYRRKRGAHSCSEFGRRVVTRFGVLKFIPLMRQRFARCAAAARALTERRKSKREAAAATTTNHSSCDIGPGDCLTGADAAECGCAAAELLGNALP